MQRTAIATALAALIALIALAPPVPAHAGPREKGEKKGAESVQWLDGESLDMGVFAEDDGPHAAELHFVNCGSEPLRVLRAGASCGCTRPTFSPRPVAPGDTGTVTVTYLPAGRPGRFSKKVYVELSGEPRHTLTIHGTVIGSTATVDDRYPDVAGHGLRMRHPSLPFGIVKNTEMRSAVLELYNASPDTLTPKLRPRAAWLRATVVPAAIPPGEQAVLSATVYGGDIPLPGEITDTLFLTPRPGAEPKAIPCLLNVVADYSALSEKELEQAPRVKVTPQAADFGRVSRTGKPLTLRLEMANAGHKPLQLKRMYCPDRAVTVTLPRSFTVKKGKKTEFSLTLNPALLPADALYLDTYVNIITNDPTEPTLRLRLIAEMRE